MFLLNGAKVPLSLAYIDPGTGSMLFTVIIGLISTLIYGLRGLLIKLKFSSTKDKTTVNSNHESIVIYSEGKRYFNTFKGILDEFENRKIHIKFLTQDENDLVFKQDYQYINSEFIGEGNKAFTKLNFLNADIVLSTTPGLDVYQWKRSKDVKYYVHIPHACNDITLYRMFGLDFYDAVLLTGDFQIDQIRKLEELRELKKKDLEVAGCLYLDEMKKRPVINNKDDNNKTILLAPSWGPGALLNKYGSELIDSLLSTGYKLIVRPHPQSFISEKELINSLIEKYPDIEFNRDNDNFDVLNRSDILISDFSGVIFDYSLVFDKPVIYTNDRFDTSIYDAWWLNEELWTFKILPLIGNELKEENFNKIRELIDDCLNNNKFKEGREIVRKQCWANESNSARSVVDYLLRKKDELC